MSFTVLQLKQRIANLPDSTLIVLENSEVDSEGWVINATFKYMGGIDDEYDLHFNPNTLECTDEVTLMGDDGEVDQDEHGAPVLVLY